MAFTDRKKLLADIERLAAVETDFLKREFLSPVTAGQGVTVRVAGIIYQFAVEPADFAGFGVFQPTGRNAAGLVREATLSERSRYLDLFPQVLLLLAGRIGDRWYGEIANKGDSRFRLSGLVPLGLCQNVQLFDTVLTRCDGSNFWFQAPYPGRARMARYLREALTAQTVPGELAFPGLTPEERKLYADLYRMRQEELREAQRRQRQAREAQRQHEELARRDQTEERLKLAAQHAGASLLGYRELDSGYTVEYAVDGARHTSVLAKGDLTVLAAGICLSGGDRQFDFQSLVGVIREGVRRHSINRVGINRHMDYDD